jgi:hypothetical protein
MPLNEAQELFGIFFAIYFALIVDRSQEAYRPFDTYNAWQGKSHNINRLLISLIILFLLPIMHFAILFILLGIFNVTFEPTIVGFLNVVLVSFSSFFEFGYFRIYEAFLHGFSELFFSEEEKIGFSIEIRPYFWAHFIPGVLYVLMSTFVLIITLYL